MMTPDEIEQEIAHTEREIEALVERIERLSGRQVGRMDYERMPGGPVVDLHMQDWRPAHD